MSDEISGSQPIDSKISHALELTQDGVMVIDRVGQVAFADDDFFRLLGQSQPKDHSEYAELLGNVQFSGGVPFASVLQIAFDEGSWAGDAAGLTDENHAILLDVRISRIQDDEGQRLGAILVARDVTRSRAMVQQVMASQRIELIEKFTRGLSHEFKNQLTIIMAYGALLLKRTGNAGLQDEINQIIETAEQSNELIDLMGVLTKSHLSRTEDFDINDTLTSIRTFLHKCIPPNISLSMPDHVSAPAVHADPVELQKAVLNLALNSIEAMPNGGSLSVDMEAVLVNEEDLDSYPLDVAGTYVVVSVSDTGRGFTDEAQRRIYEPFFTTKERGTGLGLCAVHSALEGMDAILRVYNEPGEGACVRIYLPVSEEAAETYRGDQPAPHRKQASGSILVIDDDDVARNLARKVLRGAGYAVTTTQSGMEGIAAYKRKYAQIDLVLLDVVMPNLNGKETMQRLREVRRDVPILMISGFPPRAVRELLSKDELECLSKPFTKEALLNAVERLMDQG